MFLFITTSWLTPFCLRQLLVGTANGRVKVWNLPADKVVAELVIPTEYSRIEDLAFSPANSNSFVTASNCPDRPDV